MAELAATRMSASLDDEASSSWRSGRQKNDALGEFFVGHRKSYRGSAAAVTYYNN